MRSLPTSSILLALLGLACGGLAERMMPEAEPVGTQIVHAWPGFGPQDVEHVITRPIEGMLASLPHVKRIESWSCEGGSVVTVWYDASQSETLPSALVDRLHGARASLPDDVEHGFMLPAATELVQPCSRFGLASAPSPEGETLRLLVTGHEPEAVGAAAEGLGHSLERLGLRVVDHQPPDEPELRVHIDRHALAAMGLTHAQVTGALRQATRCSSEPTSDIRCAVGELRLDDLHGITVQSSTGQAIPLTQVADIELATAPAASHRVDMLAARRLEVAGPVTPQELLDFLAEQPLPPGVSVQIER
jgi:HAE1 family hydrophobic/amphiphilic exporter-1